MQVQEKSMRAGAALALKPPGAVDFNQSIQLGHKRAKVDPNVE
jgi:hypothetical protein